jgi:hypothetical protein
LQRSRFTCPSLDKAASPAIVQDGSGKDLKTTFGSISTFRPDF